MTSQTGKNRRTLGRTVAGVAVVSGLVLGGGPLTAHADPSAPSDPAAQTAAPRPKSADQILLLIADKYDNGEGGGQVSQLIHDVMALRRLGIRPSAANAAALQAGWEYLPNQTRLIAGLQQTLAYQRKVQAQMQNAQQVPGVGPGGTQATPWVPPTNDQNPLAPNYGYN